MLVRVSRVTLPVLIVAAGLLAYRLTVGKTVTPKQTFGQPKAWQIVPRYNEPRVATDAQLHAVLKRMLPPTGPPNTNKMHHALRMWGTEANFHDPDLLTGVQMRDYFLNDGEFRRQAGQHVPPLFRTTPQGTVVVRSFEGGDRFAVTSSHHADDLLATLVKAGVSGNAPLTTRNGTTTFGVLLDTAMRRAHRAQHENEWMMIAYARCVFPLPAWKNIYGETVRADDLIDEVIDRKLHRGACAGTHRLEALTLLLRADEHAPSLSADKKQKIVDHLTEMSRLLEASQSIEGYWTRHWHEGDQAHEGEIGSLYDRLLATGHHLEWLALAPREVLPPRETIVRAGQWTVRAMLEVDEPTLSAKYGPISHAARALCLWRKMEPFQAWTEGNQTSQ